MNFLRFFKNKGKSHPITENESFARIVSHFTTLLALNNEILELIADMEGKTDGHTFFDLPYVFDTSSRIAERTKQMAACLMEMAPHKYEDLPEAYERIRGEIRNVLRKKRIVPRADYTIPLRRAAKEPIEQVGGKAANLGKAIDRLGLPVPDGFVITASACLQFLAYNNLSERIVTRMLEALSGDETAIQAAAEEIKTWVLRAELPPAMEAGLLQSAARLAADHADGLALRSSGVIEDGTFSFAGQYATFLNIRPSDIVQAYKQVVASQYGERALMYMKRRGMMEDELTMAVMCQTLVSARYSGVLFTRHFDAVHGETMLLNAVPGLGKSAVDGTVSPDTYILDRKTGAVISRRVALKTTKIAPRKEGGIEEQNLPEFPVSQPCLEQEPIKTLCEWGLKLEELFGLPQDIEWAMDGEEELYLLQARPLRIPELPEKQRIIPSTYRVLVEGGLEASFGAGSGPVFLVKSGNDLQRFPRGAVLVTAQASPELASVMDKAAAVVTDIGSATGHMAVLAREFRVPALVDTQRATQVLTQGQEVTVDAHGGRVYEGRVGELFEAVRLHDAGLPDKSLLEKLREVSRLIAPLHLTDPGPGAFNIRSIQTLHDITRFVHEMAMEEMLNLPAREEVRGVQGVRIRTTLPMNLYALDLGGGLTQEGHTLVPEHILSIPFRALWKGMTRPGIHWAGPVGVNMKGLVSVMSQSVTRADENYQDRSLALISLHYLNFSSRFGYHFSTVDAYCGEVQNDNYVTFVFNGGAADRVRRGRRARFIGSVLQHAGFEVRLKEDLVRAQYRRFPCSMTEEKLDYLGRLMGCYRQLDMAMADEATVDWYTQSFLSGNYSFAGLKKNGP